MFSARLNKLGRATSFRMALLFLALFGAISTVLFVFLYLQMSAYSLGRVDDWLQRERNALMRGGDADLAARVDYHAHLDPDNDRPFGLFDRDGRRIAGAFPGARPAIPAYNQAFGMQAQLGGRQREIRAYAHPVADGKVLLLSQDLHDFDEFNEVLLRALMWAGVLAALMGLAGAAVIGAGSVRRLDAITQAIQAIVSGDLSQRLPQRNGSRRGGADDLDRLVWIVNGMLDEIERLMHEVKGVCDGIAHDLRTPLSRLLAGLERAQRRAASMADYENAVEDAIRETLSLQTTFNAMLRISEIEDGIRRSGFTALDLGAIADDVIEFYEPSAQEKDISVEYVRDGALAMPMRGDPSLLFEALGNLMDNAVKFTPPGGRISVSAFSAGDHFGIRFADTGPGIAPAEREAVFRRFHRSESSRHTPGNGLGLSLVAAVARLHGMTVSLDPCAGGCQVSLRVPRGDG
ncbi:MAG TPA: ATP-binding protein [Janthinobacterium sp.]|jgi:signal transduction histidine kinase|nr:ATP-binding protein [Janthinobacterium sp.]